MTEIEFADKFKACALANGMPEFSSDRVAAALFRLTLRMLEVNSYMNLTAITEIDDIILKHYVDSLTVSKYIDQNSSIIDIGCGAGFPSLALAIARPDLRVTALDSTAKRINYIRETAEMLGLDNITCIAARAEELAHDSAYREAYDYACARAVARLNVLCELCLPYVKLGGRFVAMKANASDEVEEASAAINKLGGKLLSSDCFSIVLADNSINDPRCIVTIKKDASTREIYPRNNSQIKKKPL